MTAQLKCGLLFVAAGGLLAGCSGASNHPIPTLNPQSVQSSVAPANAIPSLDDLGWGWDCRRG